MNDYLLKAIESYDSIALFRHLNPDGDAFGSQFGLYTFIVDNFANKQIFVYGQDNDLKGYFPKCATDLPIDLSKTLAICLDIPNTERMDGFELVHQCASIIRIDHHPTVSNYASYEIVDTQSAATCQILVEWIQSTGLYFSQQCATYLAFGILTDSLNFAASYTSVNTLNAYAACLKAGLDHVQLNKDISQKDISTYQAVTFLRNHVIIDLPIAYAIISTQALKETSFQMHQIKDEVNVMKGIQGVNSWALFTQLEDGSFKGSLRSYQHNVNQVAVQHNGGGHLQASGCKAKDLNEVRQIIRQLKDISK